MHTGTCLLDLSGIHQPDSDDFGLRGAAPMEASERGGALRTLT